MSRRATAEIEGIPRNTVLTILRLHLAIRNSVHLSQCGRSIAR